MLTGYAVSLTSRRFLEKEVHSIKPGDSTETALHMTLLCGSLCGNLEVVLFCYYRYVCLGNVAVMSILIGR
jgi:hypothetical protein